MEEKFYSIKLISISKGIRGYVYQSKTKGINLSEVFADYCLKFPTIQEAREFVKKNKLEKNGFMSIIRDGNDIEFEMEILRQKSGLNKGSFKIVNELGQNAFWNSKRQQYYFMEKEDGCASWYDKSSVREYVTKLQSYFPDMTIRAKKLRHK